MRDLQDKFGLTYLFISHNLAVVSHMAKPDRRDGIFGPLSSRSRKAVIVQPPANGPIPKMLLGAVPDSGDVRAGKRIPVRGEIPNPIDPPPGCAFNPRCLLAFDLCRERAPALIDGVRMPRRQQCRPHRKLPHKPRRMGQNGAPSGLAGKPPLCQLRPVRRAQRKPLDFPETLDFNEQHKSRCRSRRGLKSKAPFRPS